jgi:hypothetical protein
MRNQAQLDPKLKYKAQAAENGFSNEASRYYEALLGTGQDERATDLLELILAFEPSARSYLAVVGAANRAQRGELAQALMQRGLSSLTDEAELKQLKRRARSSSGKDR